MVLVASSTNQGDTMNNKKSRKKYFQPKKPVNEMTDTELDEFAKFVFDNLVGDSDEDGDNDEKTR